MPNDVALFDAHGNKLTVRRPAALVACTIGTDFSLAGRFLCRLQFPKNGRYWSVWRCGDGTCGGFCRITIQDTDRQRSASYNKHLVSDAGFDLLSLLIRYREHTVMSPGLSDSLVGQIRDFISPSLNCACPRRFA